MNNRYSMSFTSGTLLHPESVDLATIFLELKDWNGVRNKVVSENRLQARTLNTLKRSCSEIISRIKTLESAELDLLVDGTSQEQGYLLWLAVCRRYPFIAEFATDIVRERFISLKQDLHPEDFDVFFNNKAEWRPELEQIKPSTRTKLRQVLFKMLREAGLLTPDHRIAAALLTPRLLATVSSNQPQDLLVFPAFESDLSLKKEGPNT
jgi:hypothetical protein